MRGRRENLVALLLAAACNGCGGPGSSGAEGPRLELEPVGRYGSVDGPMPLQYVTGISLSPGGDSVFVSQFRTAHLLVLSADGDSVGTIGRAGSGPGEFTQPGPASFSGDTMWVPDQSGIVSRFDRAGVFLDRIYPPTVPITDRPSGAFFHAVLDDGTLLYQMNFSASMGGAFPDLPQVRVGRDGRLMDTLAIERLNDSQFQLDLGDGGGRGGRAVVRNPVAAADHSSVDPKGRWIVVATSAGGEDKPVGHVTWIGATGDTLRTFDFEATPLGTEQEKEAFIDRLSDGMKMPRARLAQKLEESVEWSPTFPAVAAVVADDDGRTWLRTPYQTADSVRWIVLDTEARPIGWAVLPRNVRVLAAKDDDVWAAMGESDDVPYILKYRMKR